MREFYEFFAGGGMASLGLGKSWTCTFANDIDERKAVSYRYRFGSDHFHLQDVGLLTTKDIPGHATLAWASFPCQDLSLAGNGKGLNGKRSGTFRPFWNLMQGLPASDVVHDLMHGYAERHKTVCKETCS